MGASRKMLTRNSIPKRDRCQSGNANRGGNSPTAILQPSSDGIDQGLRTAKIRLISTELQSSTGTHCGKLLARPMPD